MTELEVLQRLSGSFTLEKAAICLMLAVAGYFVVKTVRLRRLGLHRRKDDPRVKDLEDAVKKMKQDAEAEVKALRTSIVNVEGIARTAVARVEEVGRNFDELKEYVHDMSHGLREELQTMTRVIGQVEGSMAQLSENVGRVVGVLMSK